MWPHIIWIIWTLPLELLQYIFRSEYLLQFLIKISRVLVLKIRVIFGYFLRLYGNRSYIRALTFYQIQAITSFATVIAMYGSVFVLFQIGQYLRVLSIDFPLSYWSCIKDL